MDLQTIKKVSVLGAGIMGHGIAQSFLLAGYPVFLYDVEKLILETAKSRIRKSLKLFHEVDLIGNAEIEQSMMGLSTTTDLKVAVQDSDFIIEAAPESLHLKQELFKTVESFVRSETIIASNTSSFTLNVIGQKVEKKDRLVITHWFNPAQIIPTVEVVRGVQTSDIIFEVTYQLLKKIKKNPVRINKELPGFLVNRIQIAMMREVFDLHEKGMAEIAEIDEAVRGSIGFRLSVVGPFRTVDMAGLDTWLQSTKNLLPHVQSSVATPKSLEVLVSKGLYGIKCGGGFYEYTDDSSEDIIQGRDRNLLNMLRNYF